MKLTGPGYGALLEKGLLVKPTDAKGLILLPATHTGGYENLLAQLEDKMGIPKDKAEKAAKYVIDKFPKTGWEQQIKEALIYLDG